MKLLANENFPGPSVALLRKAGFDLRYVCEDFPSIADDEVMELAILESRTILTHDKDYGELVFRFGYKPKEGVVYFRLEDYLPEDPAKILLNLMENPEFKIHGLFTVIDAPTLLRQRSI